jgi:glycogen debranching enzyme
MTRWGDRDGDGYISTSAASTGSSTGLKDSGDAVFHRDGRLAEPPIAWSRCRGYPRPSSRWPRWQAGSARRAPAGWWRTDSAGGSASTPTSGSRGHLRLALDRDKRPAPSSLQPRAPAVLRRARRRQARRLAGRLLQGDLFSGWGIRTLASGQPRWR